MAYESSTVVRFVIQAALFIPLLQTLTLSARYPVHDTPPDVKHSGMMINMKESNLTVFLPQHKENSVSKFNDFGKVIPPQHLGHLQEQNREINI